MPKTENPHKHVYKHTSKNKQMVVRRIIGAVVILLALTGIVSIAVFSVTAAKNAAESRRIAEIERFEKFITPVVAIEPPAFEKIENINIYTVLKSSMLLAIESNSSKLDTADDGRMKISCDMIAAAAKKLFGDKIQLEYLSFDINENLFEYDSINNCYYFPGTGHVKRFQPKVLEYSKKGDTVTLTVRYDPVDIVTDSGTSSCFRYVLEGEKGEEKIISIMPQSLPTTVKK